MGGTDRERNCLQPHGTNVLVTITTAPEGAVLEPQERRLHLLEQMHFLPNEHHLTVALTVRTIPALVIAGACELVHPKTLRSCS